MSVAPPHRLRAPAFLAATSAVAMTVACGAAHAPTTARADACHVRWSDAPGPELDIIGAVTVTSLTLGNRPEVERMACAQGADVIDSRPVHVKGGGMTLMLLYRERLDLTVSTARYTVSKATAARE
jgi:hypothetical protein